MKARKLDKRTGEKCIRAAYEFEATACRVRAAGYDSIANALADAARTLGDSGRALLDEIEGAK